jgi:glycosyltransferase involved in cell wall biosynthesis
MPLENSDDANVRADWRYYREVIEPMLREPGIEYVGEVRGRDKADFLGNARALLNPIDWPEPFGLVMAEALACGTPVVGRGLGSVPEVVTDGVTGLIGDSDEELARLCRRVEALDRAACREEAVRRFSPAAMTDGYEAVYRRLLGSVEADTAARRLPV